MDEKLLPQAPSELNRGDHDLLLTLHENIRLNFDQVRRDIKDLKDGTTTRLIKIEQDMYSPDGLIDRLAKRLLPLESYKAVITLNFSLIWGAIGTLFGVLLYLVFKK